MNIESGGQQGKFSRNTPHMNHPHDFRDQLMGQIMSGTSLIILDETKGLN